MSLKLMKFERKKSDLFHSINDKYFKFNFNFDLINVTRLHISI